MTSSIVFVLVACVLFAVVPSAICKSYRPDFEGRFILHMRQNNTGVVINTINDFIYGAAPTKFVTHGYKENKKDYQKIVDKFLIDPDIIMLSYEWEVSAHLNESEAAIAAVYLGATEVGNFLHVLQMKHKIKPDQFHLVGYGLGAHMMGAAARTQKGRIGRVTGLDPWRKYFDGNSEINLPKLSAADAEFVDIYHTNAGELGFEEAIGTVDFYPSGGYKQPKCKHDFSSLCDSLMSKEYFAESTANRTNFLARKCSTYYDFFVGNCKNNPTTYAGKFVPTNVSGIYYFNTNSKSPYGQKDKGASSCI